MSERLSRIGAQAASNAIFELGQELENRQFATSAVGEAADGYDLALTRHDKHYWGIGIRDDDGAAAIEVFYRPIPARETHGTSEDAAGHGWTKREPRIELTGNDSVDTDIIAARLVCLIGEDIINDLE